MNEIDPHYSIVQYLSGHQGYRCGYCKSSDTNYSSGMWAHEMSVGDYQDLIDRGWRRSGEYCYKPTMNKTCCPSYTIRCDITKFTLSKSQKKVMKRMHQFLSHGRMKGNAEFNPEGCVSSEGMDNAQEMVKELHSKEILTADFASIGTAFKKLKEQYKIEDATGAASLPDNHLIKTKELPQSSNHGEASTRKNVVGPDPLKPLAKKAKLIRREKHKAKKDLRTTSLNEIKKSNNEPKTIEDYVNAPLPDNPAHKLELRLLPRSAIDPRLFAASHSCYEKYQMVVHGDPKKKCNESQYKRFLCDSPLQHWNPDSGPSSGYGSFHQQYWLDNRLIAVGVIDILPRCVSSVYLYYDPEFSFLSLGTYASLREIAFTRELNRTVAPLRWYYMGFYIHSCPKMRYKGSYNPSYLLCPETYSWVSLRDCVPKLDASKYSRLNGNAADEDGVVDIKKVLCLYRGEPMPYGQYERLFKKKEEEAKETKEYAALTGSVSYSMLLVKK